MPPVQRAVDLGIRPSLSIDVEISLSSEMFSQMRCALLTRRMHATQRRYRGDTSAPRFISHRDVLEFATVAGAADVGLGGQIGSLTPGKQAYIVAIRAEDINNLPLNNAVGTVVRGTDTRSVDTVFVGGQVRKWCASWSGWTSSGFAGWPTSRGTIWRPGPVSPLTRSPPRPA